MYLKDLLTRLNIRFIQSNLSIETSGSSERFVKDIGSICSSQYDNSGCWGKSIHLYKDLIECILPLVIASSKSTFTSLTSNSINLIYEYNARSVITRLLEQVTNSCGSNSDEHLNEVRSRGTEEWYRRFSSSCLSEQCLSSTRWSNK